MSNYVLDRIQKQFHREVAVAAPRIENTIVVSPPMSDTSLYELLMKEFAVFVPVIEPVTKEIFFTSIYDFVPWYETNKELFPEAQQNALNTLVQARDGIFSGCNCKRQNREYAALEYFKNFWVNNRTTDMMPTLLTALGATRVRISDFVTYPS
jgi:hypothetical protein